MPSFRLDRTSEDIKRELTDIMRTLKDSGSSCAGLPRFNLLQMIPLSTVPISIKSFMTCIRTRETLLCSLEIGRMIT